jgi:phosphoglycolate phosphatase-like HAD superfamily hydrolase
MMELPSSIERAGASRRPVDAPRWHFPLHIKAILLDLDGTIMPSYQTLRALQYIDEQLAISCCKVSSFTKVSSFIDHCSGRHDFHTLLHQPLSVRRAAMEYAVENDIAISPAVLRTMSGLQEQSFHLYDGVSDLIGKIKRAGAFIGIYTNSSCRCAARRMHRALLLPDDVHAVWAREDEPGSIDAMDAGVLRDYAQALIPYAYRKPDDTPLRQLAMLCDASPNEILFIGDGVNDLEVVYRDWSNPRAIFCFQEQGAAGICDKTAAVNRRLRPGHIPLGAAAVNGAVERCGIERDIIRLSNGFVELLDMAALGQIKFVAPDRMPVVRNGRLEIAPATCAGGAP